MECQELLPSEGALPPEQTGAETHVVLPTEASEDVAVEPPDPTTDVDGVYSDKNHSELPVNRYFLFPKILLVIVQPEASQMNYNLIF